MKKQEPLRLGFIGGGTNSAVGYTHYSSSHLDGRLRLEAGCFSRNAVVNADSAARYHINEQRVYSSWQQLAEKEKGRLDAIVILTPTPTHKDIILGLLDSGYPVISEKALATSSKECIEIKDLLEKKRGFLGVTYNYSGYPMFRELAARCRAGYFGDLRHIQIEMPQESFIRRQANQHFPQPQQWRCLDYSVPTISLDLTINQLTPINAGSQKT